jgi:hypothetical protein
MITWRDLLFVWCGAAIAAIGIQLAGGRGLTSGFMVGAIVTGLLCWRALRDIGRELEAAELAADSFKLELLAAWGEADHVYRGFGVTPLPRPSLDDIRLNREQSEVPTP